MGFVAKTVLCILFIFYITYRLGMLVTHNHQENRNIVKVLLYGIILLLALSQMVLLPFVLMHASFDLAYITMCVILALVLVASYVIVKWKEEKEFLKMVLEQIKQQSKSEKILVLFVTLMILGQAFLSSYLFRENADDSYYISLSKQCIGEKELYKNEPSMGIEQTETCFSAFELITTYELGTAMLAHTFQIEPVSLFHTILPCIWIVYSYLSYYFLAKTFTDSKQAKWFLLFVSIIMLFTGFSLKFRAGYLLYRTWQGKAVFLNLVLTMVMALLMEFQKTKNLKLIPMITIANIASVYLSSSAIFIVSFAYLGFGMVCLLKKEWKSILYFGISFIPIVIYTGIVLVLMKTGSTTSEIVFVSPDMKQIFLNYGNKIYLMYYLFSILTIAIWGEKNAKLFFVTIPCIYAFTIWNPLFSDIIAKYLTSAATFWRVVWLIPIEFSIAYAITLLTKNTKKTYLKGIGLIASLGVLVLTGKFAYTKENGYALPENTEKIPQYIVDQTNYILENSQGKEKVVVMAPGEPWHSCMMRQLSSNIQLLTSRALYMGDVIPEEELVEINSLQSIYSQEIPQDSVEDFNQKVEKYQLDWIVIPDNKENLNAYMQKTILEKQVNMKGYDLYQVKK